MIGFNGTYLDKASHGNYRITAAAIGGQWVIGSKKWLVDATQQAIIAAFGSAEGTQVITKTNDYLNAIAATDTARAQQLERFINEDPMMVCSLGLQVPGVTMPVRYVESSKTQSIVMQKIGAVIIESEIKFQNSTGRELMGYNGDGANYWGKSGSYFEIGGRTTNVSAIVPSKVLVNYTQTYATLTANGDTYTSIYDIRGVANMKYHFFDGVGSSFNCAVGLGRTKVTDAINNIIVDFVPFILKEDRAADKCYPQSARTQGTFGMMDIEHDIFYTNVGTGTFTEKFYLPDGTPWTPLTDSTPA